MPDTNIIEIYDIHSEELKVYSGLTERQLKTVNEPGDGLFIAESPNVIDRALDAGYEPVSMLMDRRYIRTRAAGIIERCGDIPVYTSDENVLIALTGFNLTRGILCAMKRKPLIPMEKIIEGTSRIAILEEVENPTNIGAIFRSAAALGMDCVLLTPGCCDPLYRRSIRVSMGTVFQIPWGFTPEWPSQGLSVLKRHGFATAALALSDDSVPVYEPEVHSEKKLAFILGTEGEGLRGTTILSCDYSLKIPMYNGVDSLNVAAASAVAFYEASRSRK
ncbi:MAG: RNA methyltransferase [Eubacteriaceae bacterium]|nr:RNA methyltransferase [Eubacteriaceae bacterium]